MKKIIVLLSIGLVLSSFTNQTTISEPKVEKIVISNSFTLINDTKDKVTIHTGSGIVSLNKGGKTSISCKVGKEVSWAENGKKGKAIFKIQDNHCGQTVKLSSVM